jgi:hypothetical protein
VLPLALGAVHGLDTLSVPVKARGSYGFGLSHLGPPQDRWAAVGQELVAVTTLDAVVAALSIHRVDFIKADIEGWELALLRGAEQTLRRFRPAVLIELSQEHLARAGDRIEAAFAFLAALGYAAFELMPDGELLPIDAPLEGDFWFISRDNLASAIPADG